MNVSTNYDIGDQVQAQDGRIGVVIHTDKTPASQTLTTNQTIVVKFPDQSTLEGYSENFKPIRK